MAEDLSRLARCSVWPTSALAGGTARNEAMTAPGSEPAEPLEGRQDAGAPDVEAEDTDARPIEDGGQAGAGWADAWANISGRR